MERTMRIDRWHDDSWHRDWRSDHRGTHRQRSWADGNRAGEDVVVRMDVLVDLSLLAHRADLDESGALGRARDHATGRWRVNRRRRDRKSKRGEYDTEEYHVVDRRRCYSVG